MTIKVEGVHSKLLNWEQLGRGQRTSRPCCAMPIHFQLRLLVCLYIRFVLVRVLRTNRALTVPVSLHPVNTKHGRDDDGRVDHSERVV